MVRYYFLNHQGMDRDSRDCSLEEFNRYFTMVVSTTKFVAEEGEYPWDEKTESTEPNHPVDFSGGILIPHFDNRKTKKYLIAVRESVIKKNKEADAHSEKSEGGQFHFQNSNFGAQCDVH